MKDSEPSKVELIMKKYVGVLNKKLFCIFFLSQNVPDITTVNNLVVMKRSALTTVKAFFRFTQTHFDGRKKL